MNNLCYPVQSVLRSADWTFDTGPIVRIAPNRFSIDEPEAIKQIYSHGTKFVKSAFYHVFSSPDPLFYNLFALSNPERHSKERRKVASLYSMSTLVSYEQYVDSCNSLLCERLQDLACSGELFNVPDWMQFYAFDVIGEMTVSSSSILSFPRQYLYTDC